MTDPNGWPGEPGVPPLRGWWWLLFEDGTSGPRFFDGECWQRGSVATPPSEFANCRLLGPCLTPAEVAAHVEAAEAAWKTAAAEHLRNEEWMRGLLERIGNLFGAAARTSDDGTVHDSVLLLRVPELVEQLVAEVEAKVKAARQQALEACDEIEAARMAAREAGEAALTAARATHRAESDEAKMTAARAYVAALAAARAAAIKETEAGERFAAARAAGASTQ